MPPPQTVSELRQFCSSLLAAVLGCLQLPADYATERFLLLLLQTETETETEKSSFSDDFSVRRRKHSTSLFSRLAPTFGGGERRFVNFLLDLMRFNWLLPGLVCSGLFCSGLPAYFA